MLRPMICASCGDPIDSVARDCPSCGETALLRGEYRLESVLGQGASGITYRGIRLTDETPVAIKELPFRRIDSLKMKALFQREADVLRQISHPGVPAYLDDFTAGSGKNLSLYLVQELVEGRTLQAELDERRYRIDEVLRIAEQLLVILEYLHTLQPAVIHRDIKPSNVMRKNDGGALVLIDFGSVRDVVKDKQLGGSTVAGTFGYMAPEQYMGNASPASDIYGLGALVVTLLSRRDPSTLQDYTGRLKWRSFITVEPDTDALLESMLEPDPQARAANAKDVRRRIQEILAKMESGEARGAGPAEVPPESELSRPSHRDSLPPEARRSSSPPARRSSSSSSSRARRAARPSSVPPDRRSSFPSGPRSSSPPPVRRGAAGSTGSDDTSAGRASTSTRLGLWLLAALLACVAIGLALRTAQPPPEPAGSAALCAGKVCEPVPKGIKGLRFGMSVDEARAALAALGSARELEVARTYTSRLTLSGASVPLPGRRFRVKTEIGGLGAECDLDFAIETTLSKMRCQLESLSSLQTHDAAVRTLRESLESRYGRPTCSSDPSSQAVSRVLRCQWEDDEATLQIFASADDLGVLPPRSDITIENVWSKHARLTDELAARARREQDVLEARRASEENKRLQLGAQKLESDL